MTRFLRLVVGIGLVVTGSSLLAGKAWLSFGGPFLEAMPTYPYCEAASSAAADGRLAEAVELARAGCPDFVAPRRGWAQVAWEGVGDCAAGVWSGRGDGVAGVGCAVASDLFVVGDVRDLGRQGVAWLTGADTDPVLAALSAAGLALTITPLVDAGNALFKSARRVGSLSDEMAGSVVRLAARRAWRPLGNLLADAGRIARKLGPAQADDALRYADDAEELARLASFVERVDEPMLALRLAGKNVTRISDEALFQEALQRGPSGLALAAQRGSSALLARKPVVLVAAKTIYKQPEAIAELAARIASWLVRISEWRYLLFASLAMVIAGLALLPGRRLRLRNLPATSG